MTFFTLVIAIVAVFVATEIWVKEPYGYPDTAEGNNYGNDEATLGKQQVY